jgi:sugar O-acyltransferase (sialic acid O-acetyltransferase NeuD family)
VPASRRILDLVIVGAGGHAREVLDVIEAAALDGAAYRCIGFLDDDPRRAGGSLRGHAVLGDHTWILAPGRGDVRYVLGIGAPAVKARLGGTLESAGRRAATLVHPLASLTGRVALAPGVVLAPYASATTDVRLGAHAHLNVHASVSHDCDVGAYAHLAPGARLAGAVRVGEGCEVGIGAVVVPNVEIGPWSIVGAGAVVTASLPPDCTAVGVPARVIRRRPTGWHRGTPGAPA